MKCCATCIGDNGLRRTLPSISNEQGTCDYCLSEDTLVTPPSNLFDLFVPIVRIYEPNAEGKSLVQWMREDWGMFEHGRMDNTHASALLAEILDDVEIVRQPLIPSPDYETDNLSRWESLRDELMFGNRYFPKTEIKQERLIELIELLRIPADELPAIWYRARQIRGESPLEIADMGAPPREIVSHGRANPAGIPYLYLASTPTTAVAEIRPHTGENACVATFNTSSDLDVVDLRSPRHTVSPVDFGDEQEIGYLRSDLMFLSRLGEELTRPVLPRSAAVDYVPSQYLCEFIKKCGYDGVVYRSSVGDGINMALFNQDKAVAGEVAVHKVTRVHVEIDQI